VSVTSGAAHPPWCDAAHCRAGDRFGSYHRSEPAHIAAERFGQIDVTLQLWQAAEDGLDRALAFLVVTMQRQELTPSVQSYALQPSQALALIDVLGDFRQVLLAEAEKQHQRRQDCDA
jgi:hypothetical protein